MGCLQRFVLILQSADLKLYASLAVADSQYVVYLKYDNLKSNAVLEGKIIAQAIPKKVNKKTFAKN